MRKTLLLAAAALAASVISSNAQVYSQNIVGYVNQSMAANAYTALTTPLSVDTNGAEEVLTSLQVGDSILAWNGAGYNVSVYTGPGAWIDGTTGNPVPAPQLPPGKGYFYQTGSGAAETNTFVGTVNMTNQINFPANAYSFVGSTPPIGGPVESTNFTLPFAVGDSVLFWNGAGYTVSVYTGPGAWIDGTTGNPVAIPNLNVAQGFFYQTGSGTAEVWNQNF